MTAANGSRFCAPSQELESEHPPGPPSRPSAVGPRGSTSASARNCTRHANELGVLDLADATMEDEARVPRRRPAMVAFGPPTDPALDASRENDHRTQWFAPAPRPLSRRVGIALVAFVLGVAAALVGFGVWAL